MKQLAVNHARMAGLTTALIGSIWAAHGIQCQTCNNIPKLAEYSLAKLGVGFYSIALIANFFQIAQLSLLLSIAAYIHGFLVVHMLTTHQVCSACMLTAVGSITAAQKN